MQFKTLKLDTIKKRFKFTGLPYLYRGLINCSVCGCMLTPEKKKGKYVYYHCTQYHGKHGANWFSEDKLTQQFLDIFNAIKLPQEAVEEITKSLKESHEDKTHFQKDLQDRYQSEYNKFQNRIEKGWEEQLDGSITKSFYEKKRKEYREKQEILERKMINTREADEAYYINANYVLNLASRASELFESSELEQKRILIKTALQNLTIDDENLHYDWIKPFDVIAESVNSTTWLRVEDVTRIEEMVMDYLNTFVSYSVAYNFLRRSRN